MAFLVGEGLRANGITVHQTKEKFGSIRVYVGIPNTHKARRAYRDVYLHAMWACPDLADSLRSGADRPEWLHQTEEELDEAIARQVARNPTHALDAFDPRYALARMLIKGEDTSGCPDEYAEAEPGTVMVNREVLEAAHAAVAWAATQTGSSDWADVHAAINHALDDER